MKSNVKSVVVLTAICVVVATLLSVTNFFTAPVIESNKASAAYDSLYVVMADAQGFEDVELPADAPETVTGLYKETSGLGYVATLSTTSQYSSDNMSITVAIGADGTIVGVTITGYYESKDFGPDYPQTYVGADSALNGIDTFAGVTYSSTAFKEAIQDAFSVLVSSGAVAEGQKSEDQMVKDILPVILPGCADALGAAQVSEIDPAGYTAAYVANNNCGYAIVTSNDAGTIVCVINAFGDAKCYDLEGNEVEGPADEVAAAFPSIAEAFAQRNLENAKKAVGDDAVLTPIESAPSFDAVSGAYEATVGDDTYYVFNTDVFGFNNTVLQMAIVLDTEGSVVTYKPITELIVQEEYYKDHQLTDKSAYVNQFVGVNEATYSDDITMVAGATCTATAVSDSIHAAFDAFKAVKEAQ
ncbi:MAG: FMN-binding protein [bacterium]|nr:FMN-binding protein [bacterium]